jgi:hypothetical protein
MAQRHILMGDIIASSEYDARQLRREFLRLIASCNKVLKDGILSPYTVTLGDEFQGVASSLHAIIEVIFYMEETALREGLAFKIRYVAVHGQIDTPLNRLKAHAMMGAGLTKARQILTDKGKAERRFRFALENTYLMDQLSRLFVVVEGLTDRWDVRDALLILDMLRNANNAEVASMHGKDRSQIWKRRRHLLIEEYRALKETIAGMAQRE